MFVEAEPIPAFVSQRSPLEITVNFGLFAGRELSRADVDNLGEALLTKVGGVTVFGGRRYELATGATEVVAYEVRVTFPPLTLPASEAQVESLVQDLLQTIEGWARRCAATPPSPEEGLAARIAHEATSIK